MPSESGFRSPLLPGVDDSSSYYAGLRWATGLTGLDALTHGLAAGDVLVLTGNREFPRPLLAHVAGCTAGQGARVIYLSMLEREHAVTTRIVSTAARIPPAALTHPGSLGDLAWRAELDAASEQVELTVLGSAADLRAETARRAMQCGALDILVIDDASLDPVGVCHALGEQHILDGERGLPGALAHFASRRATAVLVGEPALPALGEQWTDVVSHVLGVHEEVETDVRPIRQSVVLTSNRTGSRALEVTLSHHSGIVRIDAPADFAPPSLPTRTNVFADITGSSHSADSPSSL